MTDGGDKPAQAFRGIDMNSAMRVSFLEQAAMLFASKSSSKGDVMKALSSNATITLREISYAEQIRPSKDIKRSICKKCNVYLVADRHGNPAIELKRKRKFLVRKCLNCGHQVSYAWNPNYKSRNEKAKPSE